jgi:hypothetical protein
LVRAHTRRERHGCDQVVRQENREDGQGAISGLERVGLIQNDCCRGLRFGAADEQAR